MHVPRMSHALTLLPDGSVLAIGGALDEQVPRHDTVERFDPRTETWSPAGQLRGGRSEHAAAAVPDGRVLIVGDDRQSSGSFGEIFDPATGTSIGIEDSMGTSVGCAVAVVGSTAIVAGGHLPRSLFLWTAL